MKAVTTPKICSVSGSGYRKGSPVHRLQGWPRRQKQAFYRKFTLPAITISHVRLFCFIHDQQIAGIEANISRVIALTK
ncbi:hypothetical protein J4733_26715 [Klebsiella pneumoniae]|uniref:Uncharacterized protein n=1 Tax=Klebsiella pneumoniae TaxID=573 RepID=A0A939NNA3_KLEPN|nr:hypothetical protein [Klebsiella pneumoniae]